MKRSSLFVVQLLFTLLVCAFMLVPVLMSLLAGLTRNFFVGLSSGLTFDWLIQVWQAYSPTVWLSLQLAVACAVCVCVIGVPAAYALVRMNNRFSRAFEELMVLPVAMPGLASALALLLTYGQFGTFRSSWLFILVGHVLFTLPFLVRPVMAVMHASICRCWKRRRRAWAPGRSSAFSAWWCPTAGQGFSRVC